MTLADRLREIFPSKWHSVFFVVYVLLYIFNAILIRLSKRAGENSYDYDTVSVVLVTEVTKLGLASSIYLWQGHSLWTLGEQLLTNRHLALFYLVPAILYCVYNNLTYVNLSFYDPTTYYILLQLRIAVTGVIYQIVFQKKLSPSQWISLLLLTFGCIIKQLGSIDFTRMSSNGHLFNGYLLLIAVQIFCSCMAGVYNEYLLKGQQQKAEVHLMIQNIYMYLDSIVCNLFAVSYARPGGPPAQLLDLSMFANAFVLAIVCTNAFCGLSTSFFIKTFNSIMKSYTTGVELLLTALICSILFATPLDIFTLLSIVVVSYATYLFARNPVVNSRQPYSAMPTQKSPDQAG